MRILLVEDNEQILLGNERMFRRRGYEVAAALTLAGARECLAQAAPDAIVLDIMMPDGNGLDFMRELRQSSDVPVLLLTGLTTSEDIVRGLSEGGDDYLTKPYDFSVLLARIEALLRRAGRARAVLRKGALSLDVMAGQASLHEKPLRLTRKDFELLLLFTNNEGRVMSARHLYETVWKLPLSGDTQAVKSAISRLRKKLEGSGCAISSVRGEGYMFVQED